jgi:hypothetical protein
MADDETGDTSWEGMPGSHGPKPPVSPRPYAGLMDIKRMVREVLGYTRNYLWPGDRINREQLTKLLAISHFILSLEGDEVDEVDEVESLPALLERVASIQIEDEDDTTMLAAAWLTADDIADRLKHQLKERKYWWEA